MAASGWVRAALVLLCASDLLLPPLLPRACAAEGAAGTPGEASPPPRKKKKDIRDYNDADMARLLEQWEVRARAPAGCSRSRAPLPLTSGPSARAPSTPRLGVALSAKAGRPCCPPQPHPSAPLRPSGASPYFLGALVVSEPGAWGGGPFARCSSRLG